uniref:Uncharacterized protein n=1 Tax=Anopheles merus TaxID=30066 RepID=A0A182V2W5_ANOME
MDRSAVTAWFSTSLKICSRRNSSRLAVADREKKSSFTVSPTKPPAGLAVPSSACLVELLNAGLLLLASVAKLTLSSILKIDGASELFFSAVLMLLLAPPAGDCFAKLPNVKPLPPNTEGLPGSPNATLPNSVDVLLATPPAVSVGVLVLLLLFDAVVAAAILLVALEPKMLPPPKMFVVLPADPNPAPPPKPLNSFPPDSADLADGGVVREAGCNSGLLPVVAVLAPSFLLSVLEVTWAPVPTAVTVLVGAGETNDVFGVVLSDAEKIDPPVAAEPSALAAAGSVTVVEDGGCWAPPKIDAANGEEDAFCSADRNEPVVLLAVVDEAGALNATPANMPAPDVGSEAANGLPATPPPPNSCAGGCIVPAEIVPNVTFFGELLGTAAGRGFTLRISIGRGASSTSTTASCFPSTAGNTNASESQPLQPAQGVAAGSKKLSGSFSFCAVSRSFSEMSLSLEKFKSPTGELVDVIVMSFCAGDVTLVGGAPSSFASTGALSLPLSASAMASRNSCAMSDDLKRRQKFMISKLPSEKSFATNCHDLSSFFV